MRHADQNGTNKGATGKNAHTMPFKSNNVETSFIFDGSTIYELEEWIRTKIPEINDCIWNGEINVSVLKEIVRHYQAFKPALFYLDDYAARKIHSSISHLVSILESHSQREGNKPGEVTSSMPFLPWALKLLSTRLNSLPYSSHLSYWIENNEATPNRFSKQYADSENTFQLAVMSSSRNHSSAALYIKKFLESPLSIATREASIQLRIAAEHIQEAYKANASLMRKKPNGELVLTVDGFNRMRNSLVSTVIDGKTYMGPNAVNIGSIILLDLLMGIADEYYIDEVLPKRIPYLTQQEVYEIKSAIDSPNVIDLVAEMIGISADKFKTMSAVEMQNEFTELSSAQLSTVYSISQIMATLSKLTRHHMALIVKYVMNHDNDKSLVGNDKGVSGNSLDEVRRIRLMRAAKDSLNSRFISGVRLAWAELNICKQASFSEWENYALPKEPYWLELEGYDE